MTGISFTKFELLITDWTHITDYSQAERRLSWSWERTWSSILYEIIYVNMFLLIANLDFWVLFDLRNISF